MSCSSTNTLLVGTRFNPTDEELLSHYLKEKMLGKDSPFPEIDYCKYEPCDLIALLVPTKDMERFFYSPRHKYRKGFKRTTEHGFWKPQGDLRGIKAPLSNAVIGNKRILTFYEGRAPNSSKTNYTMHEYDLAETDQLGSMPRQNGDLVLCRLKINPDKSHKKKGISICEEANPASYIASNFENLPAQENGESLFYPRQPQEFSSSTLLSPLKELGVVLQANGNSDVCNELQSPFGDNGFSLTNRNDIPTYDGSNTLFDFEKQDADNVMMQSFAQPQNIMNSLLHQTQLHHSQNCYPSTLQSQMYCFSTQQSPIYTNLVFPQPEENLKSLFQPIQPQDYMLQMDT